MKRIALTVLVLSCLGFAAQAQTTIDRVRMTDNDLSCQQAYNEIGQMDGVLARSRQPVAAVGAQVDPNAAQNAAVAGAVAQAAIANAAARGGFGFGGFGGGFGGGGSVGGLFGSLVQQAAAQGAQQAATDQAAAAATTQQNAMLASRPRAARNTSPACFWARAARCRRS